MSNPTPTSSAPASIVLGDALEIGAVTALRAQMNAALNDGSDEIELRAERVERVDAASLQLILSFVRAARFENRDVRWHAPSRALRDAATNTGLSKELGLDNKEEK